MSHRTMDLRGHSLRPFSLWLGLALVLVALVGCGDTANGLVDAVAEQSQLDAPVDRTLDERPRADRDDGATDESPLLDAKDDLAEVEPPIDARADGPEDARRDLPDLDADVPRDVVLDQPDARDGGMDRLDIVIPDALDIGPDPFADCTAPRADVPDAPPPCMPDGTSTCRCAAGPTGSRTCLEDRTWSACQCPLDDAGAVDVVARIPPDVFIPIPAIAGPRLLAPQSGSRVTSQRPTFRWRLPEGVTHARVELCTDRPCARMLTRQEVTGSSWRPTMALAPGVVFWRVRGLNASGVETWASATWEFGVPRRDTPVDTSYGVLKDFNGDGYDDVVAQSSYRRTFGGIRVFPGSAGGLDERRVRVLNPPEQPSWDTDRDSIGSFGRSFAVGDLNGDGLSDLVAGDDLYRELSTIDPLGPATDGRVYVFFGSRACLLARSEVSYRPTERRRPFDFGHDVSAGDFNGDGYADMLVAGEQDRRAEGLTLYPGGPGGPSDVPVSGTSVGASTAQFVGDVNGDGYADILATSWSYIEAGLNDFAMVALYGNPDGRLDFHVQYIELPFRSSLFGWLIQWGDVNEDNYADAVVSFNGYVYIFYGSTDGLRRSQRLNTPPDTGGGTGATSFGIGLSMPADVDGDGHAELGAGAEAFESRVGRVYVYSVTMGDLPTMWTQEVVNPVPENRYFSRVAIPGDINGDGFNDVVIGAPYSTIMPRGYLYLYPGGVSRWWEVPSQAIMGLSSAFGRRVQ